MAIIDEIKEKVEEGLEKAEEVVEEIVEKIEGKNKKKISRKSPKAKKEEFSKEEEKLAELESLETEISGKEKKTIEEKKKELIERAKKLSEQILEPKTEELKEKVKAKKRTEMLIPLEEYVKSGIYIGKRAVTPDMKPFVYRRRADGLAIFDTNIIDEKIKEAIEFISKFNPEEIILVCKRQTGWNAAEMFSKLTGIRVFTKKYPAGILTNTNLPTFMENELTIVTDSWLDKNALHDTLNVHKKVLMICDTNNFAKGADKVIIGNNKSSKSLGLIFYLLARGYCKARGIDAIDRIPDMDWWMKEELEVPVVY
ncbi:30S ribosomal protein S2 [Candidatus Pacearchaeota archaeon]|nr:30S ribosomal protein S2 [Candidatus Pacearchaeota archaeon]